MKPIHSLLFEDQGFGMHTHELYPATKWSDIGINQLEICSEELLIIWPAIGYKFRLDIYHKPQPDTTPIDFYWSCDRAWACHEDKEWAMFPSVDKWLFTHYKFTKGTKITLHIKITEP